MAKWLGLFKSNAYPWSERIDDFDVITCIARSPDVFLHYMEQRIAQQKLDVRLKGDELDIFGQYLDNRFNPDFHKGRKKSAKETDPK